MIKLIIFDLWSTIAYHKYKNGSLKDLCKRCYVKNYRKFLKTYEGIFQKSKNVSFEKGFKKLFDELNVKLGEDKVKEFAARRKKYESEYDFYSFIFPLIKRLKKKGYKVALLSNVGSYLGEKIKKTKAKNYFDKLFFSYEIGSIKPNPKNFRKVLKNFNVKANEALMIGDNYHDDYLAAKKLGMDAYWLKDKKFLLRDLIKRNIL